MSRIGSVFLLAGTAVALASCGSKTEPAAQGSASSVTTAEAPAAPVAQIETRTAPVMVRALAANGKAEAQVVEASRSGGVLTLNVRFQRAQGATSVETLFSEYEAKAGVYVVAGDKKYFALTDAEGKPLATPSVTLRFGEDQPVAGLWFGKFPAPPPEIKQISLVLPNVAPLDNIPLTDR